MNFLNALERIPKLVEQYKAQNVTYERDIPILQETVGQTGDVDQHGRIKLNHEIEPITRHQETAESQQCNRAKPCNPYADGVPGFPGLRKGCQYQ